MKCSKPRFGFRLLVEYLEDRLQPGSMITGQGFGFSLLADNLSVLDQGPLDTQSLVSQAPSESSKPSLTSTASDVASDHFDIAVASVASARSQPSSLPSSNWVDNGAASLTKDDLSLLSLTGRPNAVPVVAAGSPVVHQTPAAPVSAGVPQSAIGVAHRAPLQNHLQAAPVIPTALDTPTRVNNAGLQGHAAGLRAAALPPITGGPSIRGSLSFSTYLGGAGEDGLSAVVTSQENGQTFLYVSGYSDTSGTGKVDAVVAKFSGDGTTLVWATSLSGMQGRDEAHGLAVQGGSVYVAGSLTNAGGKTDAFVAQLDLNGTVTASAVYTDTGGQNINFQSLAVDSTSPTPNVYIAGSTGDVGSQNILFLKVNASDLTTPIYASAFTFMAGDSSVQKSGSLGIDSQGNAYFTGTLNDGGNVLDLFGSLSADGQTIRYVFAWNNVTPGANGGGTGVVIDDSGHFYMTGALNNDGGTGRVLHQDLLVAKVEASDGSIGVGDYAFRWLETDDNNDPAGDFAGNAIQINSGGDAHVATAFVDVTNPRPTTVNAAGVHFGPGGDTLVDSYGLGGELGGSGRDVPSGIALDAANNAYLAGVTQSNDFPTTAGVVQPNYGGGPSDGFVAAVRI